MTEARGAVQTQRSEAVAASSVLFFGLPIVLGMGITPMAASAQRSFDPTHIERTGSVEFQASPSEVFPALEPAGKSLRAPSWDVELLYPASGEGRPGAVLRQTHKRAGIQQIWTVVESDPPNRIKYVVYVPDMETWEFDMHLIGQDDGSTIVQVQHRITSLSEEANSDVQRFADGFEAYLVRWQRSVSEVIGALKS